MPASESEFLREINADLPEGVDWKEGAVTYLRELVVEGGAEAERFHLVKPFVGGSDFSSFWVDVFQFLDVVERADLDPRRVILDVGCGPGWTVHWLAKLGHTVIGLDISQELLDIAEARMASDPYPPFPDEPFHYDLRVHDIEAQPLGLEHKAHFALFESTLHHFHDPVAALRNVAADMEPDGILAVIEAAAPPVGSEWHAENVELMRRYHTIERPYTREQLHDLLELSGFGWCQFYRPVNGLYAQESDSFNALAWELGRADNINIVLASQTREGIERIRPGARPLAEVRAGRSTLEGFSAVQTRPDGSRYRWCGARGQLRLHGAGPHRLHLATVGLEPGESQQVFVVVDGAVSQRTELTAHRPSAELTIEAVAGQLVELQSDRVFSPCWKGEADDRLLSFTLDEPAP